MNKVAEKLINSALQGGKKVRPLTEGSIESFEEAGQAVANACEELVDVLKDVIEFAKKNGDSRIANTARELIKAVNPNDDSLANELIDTIENSGEATTI
jgi:hypothetical protein